MSATAPLARREGYAATPSQTWLAAAALVAVAVAIQLKFGMMADVAWLVDCDQRWLAGAVPYRDFVEINPPASLLLYLAPVAAARALGIAPEIAVSLFGFLSAGAALGLSALILRRGRPVGASVTLSAVIALVVLPGETFCERDHLAAVFGAPLLALALARAEGLRVNIALALVAGVGAGVMAAIKPPYALIGLMLAGFVAIRVGTRTVLKAPEYCAAAAVGLAYVASVGPLFPDYVANVLPLGVAIYVPSRESFATLVASTGALLALLIGATAALTAGGRYTTGFVVAALAALGAGVGYFLQGKGWIYQAIPAAMFATLAGGFALEGRRGGLGLAAAGVAAALGVSFLHSIGLALGLGLAVGLLAARVKFAASELGPLALAAAIGAACGVCVIERPQTPALESELKKLGPGVTLGAVTEDMGLPFPLAHRVGAHWAMRSNSLFVTAAVRRLLSRRPGDAARLQAYADAERKQMIDDIVANRPEALLVGPLGTSLHADVWADSRLQAVMADYLKVAVEERPGYSAELWVRKDFAPAR